MSFEMCHERSSAGNRHPLHSDTGRRAEADPLIQTAVSR